MAIPFLYALLFKFTFRNLPKALMPNIHSCWSNENARAVDFFAPTPSKRAKLWAINFFYQQQ